MLEELIELRLAAGRHDEVLPELEQLVAEHPLRERLRRQQMVALYRAGRQSEALEVHEATRQRGTCCGWGCCDWSRKDHTSRR